MTILNMRKYSFSAAVRCAASGLFVIWVIVEKKGNKHARDRMLTKVPLSLPSHGRGDFFSQP